MDGGCHVEVGCHVPLGKQMRCSRLAPRLACIHIKHISRASNSLLLGSMRCVTLLHKRYSSAQRRPKKVKEFSLVTRRSGTHSRRRGRSEWLAGEYTLKNRAHADAVQ